MTEQEIIAKIEEACEDYASIGIRFEDMARNVGDICGNSKDNPDRADERDFPVYGSEEYDELPELDGTCAWGVGANTAGVLRGYEPESAIKNAATKRGIGKHCHLIASDQRGDTSNYAADDGEVLLVDPVVIAVIY